MDTGLTEKHAHLCEHDVLRKICDYLLTEYFVSRHSIICDFAKEN